jgi:hypothetical protein
MTSDHRHPDHLGEGPYSPGFGGYQHHRTRVVTNPRGYISWKGEVENQWFDPGLVIEVGGGHG